MLASWAFLRAAWLSAASYRVRSILSVFGMVVAVVPLFFVSRALQPVMAGAIRDEGGQYFGFLLLGTIVMTFVPLAVQSIATAVHSSIGSGTLESLLETPTSVAGILGGLVSYDVAFTLARAVLMLAAGAMLGAAFSWPFLPAALLILAAIVITHVPFGLMAAAGILVFRTAGPLPQGVLALSGLLGGVYYPTHVIPGWLEQVARITPLTYGLRPLRRVLLQGVIDVGVWRDLAILTAFAVPLWIGGVVCFSFALRYARRVGNLGRY